MQAFMVCYQHRSVHNFMISLIFATMLVCAVLIVSSHEQPKQEEFVGMPAMISTIEHYLSTIKNKDFATAYDKYLDFTVQDTTPFALFKSYIDQYPSHVNHNAVTITDPYVENGMGSLEAKLESLDDLTLVEYGLALRGNQWKIIGMHINKISKTTDARQSIEEHIPLESSGLVDVVQAFLTALRKNEVREAYENYTSILFKKEISIPLFDRLLEEHPLLVNHSSWNFGKLMFNNKIATLSGTLIDKKKHHSVVEFDLIQDNNKWKILHIVFNQAIVSAEK